MWARASTWFILTRGDEDWQFAKWTRSRAAGEKFFRAGTELSSKKRGRSYGSGPFYTLYQETLQQDGEFCRRFLNIKLQASSSNVFKWVSLKNNNILT